MLPSSTATSVSPPPTMENAGELGDRARANRLRRRGRSIGHQTRRPVRSGPRPARLGDQRGMARDWSWADVRDHRRRPRPRRMRRTRRRIGSQRHHHVHRQRDVAPRTCQRRFQSATWRCRPGPAPPATQPIPPWPTRGRQVLAMPPPTSSPAESRPCRPATTSSPAYADLAAGDDRQQTDAPVFQRLRQRIRSPPSAGRRPSAQRSRITPCVEACARSRAVPNHPSRTHRKRGVCGGTSSSLPSPTFIGGSRQHQLAGLHAPRRPVRTGGAMPKLEQSGQSRITGASEIPPR